jgi:hypothetical protein
LQDSSPSLIDVLTPVCSGGPRKERPRSTGVLDGGNGINSDHADWLEPLLLR